MTIPNFISEACKELLMGDVPLSILPYHVFTTGFDCSIGNLAQRSLT